MNTQLLQQEIEKLLGVDGYSPEGKRAVVEQLTENVLLNMALRLLPRLPEEARPEFERLDGERNFEGMMAFLEKHVFDFGELTTMAARETVSEYRELMGLNPLV